MKKLLSVLLVLAILFSLAACGTPKGDNGDGTTTSTPAAGFVKPADYATVVLISINPQFRLYLDSAGAVLAVEPVNDDAKSISQNITTQSGDINAVVENIISAANDGGFVKENAVVDLRIVELKAEVVDAAAVLDDVKESADEGFKAIEKTVEIRVNEEIPQTTTSSDAAHTHVFSEATCTEAKKCNCGAEEGAALGHDYKDGKCTRCKAADPDYQVSYTAISAKGGKWSYGYVVGTECHKGDFTLVGECMVSYMLGDLADSLREAVGEEFWEEFLAECEKFNGKYYYFARGDGAGISSVKEDGNTVTVTDEEGNKMVLSRTGEDTMKVTSCDDGFAYDEKLPKGTVLTHKK